MIITMHCKGYIIYRYNMYDVIWMKEIEKYRSNISISCWI